MKVNIAVVSVFLIAVAVSVSPMSCNGSRPTGPQQNPASKVPIDQKKAVELARKASEHMDIPDAAPVEVEKQGDVFVVTFVCPRTRPVPGPDYYAKVRIDGKTGDILELLIGS